jgi:hypothetical protein
MSKRHINTFSLSAPQLRRGAAIFSSLFLLNLP